MRELGRRWRPIGYGALLVLGVTGVPLAANDWDTGPGFRWTLLAKVVSAAALAASPRCTTSSWARASPARFGPASSRARVPFSSPWAAQRSRSRSSSRCSGLLSPS
jgi:hypothetical protein